MTQDSSSDAFHEEDNKGNTERNRKHVLGVVTKAGAAGISQGEVWMALKEILNNPTLDRNIITPRFSELRQKGHIRSLPKRRPCGVTGKSVMVWVAGADTDYKGALTPAKKLKLAEARINELKTALWPLVQYAESKDDTWDNKTCVLISLGLCRIAKKIFEQE